MRERVAVALKELLRASARSKEMRICYSSLHLVQEEDLLSIGNAATRETQNHQLEMLKSMGVIKEKAFGSRLLHITRPPRQNPRQEIDLAEDSEVSPRTKRIRKTIVATSSPSNVLKFNA